MSYNDAMQLPKAERNGLSAPFGKAETSVNPGRLGTCASQKPFPSSYSQASGIKDAPGLVVENRFNLFSSIASQQTGRARS
ncbi:MAG: hypothetical protein HYT71_03945 [Candidatus Aenigmarchaeota archaeon]|nr:hypothetical protein [Candidatus Aenigmarchaeota archaeon]